MRQVLAGLLASILVALLVIAYQLGAIARELNRLPVSSPVSVSSATPAPETREQRNLRLQREQRERELDALAIWNTPAAPTKKVPATPR